MFLHSNTSKLGIIIPLNFNALKGWSHFFDMKENVHGVYVFFKLSNGYSIHLTVLGWFNITLDLDEEKVML